MMSLPRELLPEKSFLRKLFMLASGTIAGQTIVIASSPLLTRLFTPAEFGQFAVFASLIAIAVVAACLRFECAIPIIHDEDEAAAMVLAAAMVAVAVGAAVALFILLLGDRFVAAVGAEALRPWLWLLPPAVLVWGWGSVLSYWSVRRGTYRINGLNRTYHLGSQAGGQILFGLFGTGTTGLILGYLVGYLVRLKHHALHLPRAERRRLIAHRPGLLWRVLRINWRYPAYSSGSSLLQSICDMAPVILVAALYGPAVAGLYALCQRVIALPLRFLSEAASQVFLGELRGLDGRKLYSLFRRTVAFFVVLGILGMLPLVLFAPTAFALLFGEPWREAGVFIQLLVPLYFAYFIVFPVSQLLHVLKRQDVHLLSAVLNAAALAGSFGSAFVFDLGAYTTVLLFSIGAALAHAFHLIVAWHLVKQRLTVSIAPIGGADHSAEYRCNLTSGSTRPPREAAGCSERLRRAAPRQCP